MTIMTTLPTITKELSASVKEFVSAKESTDSIRPLIESKKQEWFKLKPRYVAAEWVETVSDTRISDHNSDYLLSDDDFQSYMNYMRLEYANLGLEVEEGCCPLAMAENAQQKASWAMFEAAEYLTGFTHHQCLCSGLESVKKAEVLITGAVFSHPEFK